MKFLKRRKKKTAQDRRPKCWKTVLCVVPEVVSWKEAWDWKADLWLFRRILMRVFRDPQSAFDFLIGRRGKKAKKQCDLLVLDFTTNNADEERKMRELFVMILQSRGLVPGIIVVCGSSDQEETYGGIYRSIAERSRYIIPRTDFRKVITPL